MENASTDSFLADTHAFVWHLLKNPALGDEAETIFHRVLSGQARILISSISVVEAIYLRERQRISPETLETLLRELRHARNYYLVPVDDLIAEAVAQIDPLAVPEMPDRIIAATARIYDVPVITKDRKLRACSSIKTVW